MRTSSAANRTRSNTLSRFAPRAALLTTFLTAMSQAGPLVIEETSKIELTSPDPTLELGGPRIDGNTLIVEGTHTQLEPFFSIRKVASLYERDSAGAWQYVRTLTDITQDEYEERETALMLSGDVAAVLNFRLRTFERTATGWAETDSVASAHNGNAEISSGMILMGDVVFDGVECSSGGTLVEKQAGIWRGTHVFPGDPRECADDESIGNRDVDITHDRVMLSGYGKVYIYNRNADGSWPVTATSIVQLPLSIYSGNNVAIDGDDAIASGGTPIGPYVLRGNGAWTVAGNLHRADERNAGGSGAVELLNGTAVVAYPGDPHRGWSAGSIAVFQKNASGEFEYVAKLLASNATEESRLGAGGIQISGRTIYAHSLGETYVFDLPDDLSQPALIQDDFEDRNAAEWTHIAGSNVSVVSNGSSFVYRQSSLSGGAGSVRTGLDMTNQAIEADVLPRSFAAGGSQRWFGLTVRQTSPDSYYYVTVRNTNVVSLRKIENGVAQELASAPMAVALNRPYKLRLEAVGTWIRAYVDGRLIVEAQDRTYEHGTAGIRMYKTSADYDNVVISPNAQVTLYDETFDSNQHTTSWVAQAGTWFNQGDFGQAVFVQSSLAGGAHISAAVDADDQAIQVRARATRYSSGSGNQRWFGVLARLRDFQNYYHVTVRNNNTVSLRKQVNGQTVVLDTAPLPVSLGTWYTLRLEAVGSALRTYVNGRLLLEANDSTHAEGSYGLATYKTRAQFDDFIATQP